MYSGMELLYVHSTSTGRRSTMVQLWPVHRRCSVPSVALQCSILIQYTAQLY